VTRSRTLKGSAATVLAALLLSACNAHPGSAAVVGDDRISTGEVDDVATALCAAQGSSAAGGGQPLASRSARQGALDVLVNSALSRQFGAAQGVEPDQEQVSAALAANEQNIQALPADQRGVFRTTLQHYAEGQLMLLQIGRRSLAKKGTRNASDQQAVSEGTRLRNAWAAKHASVSVDPRFGSYTKNGLVAKSGSLSVPVSQSAADGASPDPSAGWVSALPASQKCS
jgi:hypothetical protein